MLSVTNPDSGSATEELEVEYEAEPIDIGFNSRYLLDIAAQIESEAAVLKLADPGSPTLIQDKEPTRRALRADADAGVRTTAGICSHCRSRKAEATRRKLRHGGRSGPRPGCDIEALPFRHRPLFGFRSDLRRPASGFRWLTSNF